MHIRQANLAEHPALVEIWLRSVRATHTFLTEQDIEAIRPLVPAELSSLELWVLCGDNDAPVGFLGMSDCKLEALFLSPDVLRRGNGRRLVQHAVELYGNLTVDVNEQNESACRFYEACGFITIGRSETDSAGRPFPLVHMELKMQRSEP